jgi:hypothetical protein
MPNSYYTIPTANADGETADAADVNTVSEATDAAFDLVEAAVTAIAASDTDWAALAQGWAETAEDTPVPTQGPTDYSSLHYAAKSAASAAEASTYASNASTSASQAAGSASNAATSASNASDSADAASDSASTASTQAGLASSSASSASASAIAAAASAGTATTQATLAANSANTASAAVSSCQAYVVQAQAAQAAAEAAVASIPGAVLAEGTGIDITVAAGVSTITVDLTELDVDANVTRPGAAQLVGITQDCTAAAFIQIDINADMDGWVLSDLISANSTAGVTGSNIVAAYKNGWTTGTLMATSTVASAATQSGAVSLEAEAARTVAEGDQVTIGITTIHSGTAAKGCNVTFSWNG